MSRSPRKWRQRAGISASAGGRFTKRKHNWSVSHHSIWRLYKAHGLNRLGYKKKWPRYPQRYSQPLPGDRVQVDVKFLKNINLTGRYYQFTAIDDCTRLRVLRIYDHNTVKSANDWHLQDLGIAHRKTRVRSPEENGKVERSHRTDEEEFYRINQFVSIQHCMRLLRLWEREYNEDRPHASLNGQTPTELLQEKLKNHVSKSVQEVP